MIKTNDIISALKNVLKVACADCKEVYTEEMPQDFERPSLYISLQSVSRTAITCKTMQNKAKIKINCFAVKDDYGYCTESDLNTLMGKVMQVIDDGYIRTGDRAVELNVQTGEIQADYAYITVDAIYTTARNKSEKEYDLMRVVKTNLEDRKK
ncbi:MAG: hypothetical protein KIG86_10385 [Eubacteriales bacterium]|jgi:hypothetical protein|nr:hypothetical protein [Eubacteriales bacterium]